MEEWCTAGPWSFKQRKTAWECADWGQPWMHGHAVMEYGILYGGSKAISRIVTLDFRGANFDLFKVALGGVRWFRALEMKGA